jgi:heme a synthase
MGVTPWLRRLGWATLVANCALVVTGGAVRLTGSGLGCPTWPRCTDESFTPHGALDLHSAIEFGNRTLTFVLAGIAIATYVAAYRSGRRDLRRLALLLGLGIPAQAVIGGITVLTDLNPWVVSFHMVPSLAIIGLAVLFLHRMDHPDPVVVHGPVVTLAWCTFAAAWAVMYVGTIVTGAGPNAGDENTSRNGLDPLQISQLHADLVFLLVGLTLGLLLALRAAAAGDATRRAALVLLGIEVGQGAVGFVQYFSGLPVLVVGLHMLGTALVSAAVTWVLVLAREDTALGREPAPVDDDGQPAPP